MRRGLLALCVFLAREPAARADLINKGDRCIPLQATFSNLDAFPGYRFALVGVQFPRADEESPGPTGVRFLEEGARLEREPDLLAVRELMAIPREVNVEGLSMQGLLDAGALRSNVVFHTMRSCFPSREPGALEVHAFRAEHLDPPHVGVRTVAVERRDEAGRVVQKFRALPAQHVIDLPADQAPSTLSLVTRQKDGWQARAVEPGQAFTLAPWPPVTVVIGAPPPQGASIEGWLQGSRERVAQWPLDPLYTLFVPEDSRVRWSVIHHSLDDSRPPRLRYAQRDGWDSSGTRYFLDGTSASRFWETPELRGWFAGGVALAMLAVGALLRATRSR